MHYSNDFSYDSNFSDYFCTGTERIYFCVFFVQIRCHFITTGIIKNNYYISILDWNPLSLRLKNPTTRATEESVHVAAGVVDRHTEDQFFYAVCFN